MCSSRLLHHCGSNPQAAAGNSQGRCHDVIDGTTADAAEFSSNLPP